MSSPHTSFTQGLGSAETVPHKGRDGDGSQQEAYKSSLIEYHQLQAWQRDNEYILSGYRPLSNSLRRSMLSIFALHNETVNIWSHGLGVLVYLFGPLALFYLVDWYSDVSAVDDRLMLAIFFASVVVCFIFSSSFHILLNHSPHLWYVTSQLDHLGIVLVIWGSLMPSIHFGFHDNATLHHFYWNLATASGLLAGVGTMHPRFRTPAGRKWRFLFYCLLGSTTFISAYHGVKLYGYEEQSQRMELPGFMGLGVLNFTGAATYALRIPERWYPRRFDIYGSSHQIMHILVACGAASHAWGLIAAARYWSTQSAGTS